ncbi:uncharacterized protein LOC133818326 isoform X2 [Humulus lupulus]|uniref:uncharacterized protein LOC133818326 isoform X2 n=1 Tax=Humulus lupulus TaxID=3486 RepID=UPI002B40E74D|nr:uncharacterized protein LOC133818326 isoform X2 [Humulus lupulus]
MASKVPDEGSNTKTEDENLALRTKNKRSRRVSFADTEITSVHFFHRDEDYETPPDSKPSSRTIDAALEPDNEVIGFFRELGGDSDDSGDDEGSSDGRKSFLRPMGSPSPGSSTAGSVTSNDEDNFFGPVSSSFIRPGRLSDSAASDEHHEATLDQTTFSLHYRSIARSDSGDPKTPTAVRLVFEEKTATKDSNRTDSGNSMALTEFKKVSSQALASYENVRVGEDSDDMSMVDANPDKYNYGWLSPTLDALLAESSNDVNADPVNISVNSKSPMRSEVLRYGANHMDSKSGRDSEFDNFDTHENSAKVTSISNINLGQAIGGSPYQIASDYLSDQNNGQTTGVSNYQMQTPSPLISVRQPSIMNTPTFARDTTTVSPFSKLTNAQSNDYMKHDQDILSNQKSNSRLINPNISYMGSNIKQGTDNLKRRLSKYSHLSSPYGSFLDKDDQELLYESVGAPVACLEEQFNEDIVGLVKDGETLDSISIGILKTPLSSQVQLASSGGKVMHHALISENSANKMLFASGTDSTLAFDHQSPQNKVILNSENSHIITKSPASTIYGSGATPRSTTLEIPSIKELSHISFKDVPIQCPTTGSPNQKTIQKDSIESPSRKNLTESYPRKLMTKSPLRKEPTLRSPKKVQPQNSPRKESTMLSINRESSQCPSMEKLILSPLGNRAIQSSTRKEPTEKCSRTDSSKASNGGDMPPFLGKDVSSPQSDSIGHVNNNLHEEHHTSQSPFSQKDAEISFERKRSAEFVLEDGKDTYKNPRVQKSPGLHQIGNDESELLSFYANKKSSETEKTVGDRSPKHWLDILAKFSRDADPLLSPSTNKLNFKAISMLEDVLLHFLKIKKYEMLGSEIQSQKVADHSSVRHNKRITETRLLLYKLVYEKAKQLLMCIKHEKLLKKGELLTSGIEESQMLKSNFIQQLNCRRDTQLVDCHLQSCSDNLEGECLVLNDTISSMKLEIKTLDGKINSLSNFLHNYSKCKGELSYANSLASVQHHLKRKQCCRLIRHELQLWKVDGFESQNGHYNVLLNYQGYLSQRYRFTLNSGPVSGIVVSNQLNDINVMKIFPNMDAHIAFAFVLNAEAVKRVVASKCLVQETQVTHSLLCNLLGVIEEVQMAQIEITNLIQTNFFSPSGQQLSLQLCFINFHTGRKVALTLDVTCLNSGVYPSEILPYQVQDPQTDPNKSKSFENEVRSATENLEVGYMRIMRLCRCVSQVLQASST